MVETVTTRPHGRPREDGDRIITYLEERLERAQAAYLARHQVQEQCLHEELDVCDTAVRGWLPTLRRYERLLTKAERLYRS
jgi:hypothetical protein